MKYEIIYVDFILSKPHFRMWRSTRMLDTQQRTLSVLKNQQSLNTSH